MIRRNLGALIAALVVVFLARGGFATTVITFEGQGGNFVGDDYIGLGVRFVDAYYADCFISLPEGDPRFGLEGTWIVGEPTSCYNGTVNQSISGEFTQAVNYLAVELMYRDAGIQAVLAAYDEDGGLVGEVFYPTDGPHLWSDPGVQPIIAEGIRSFTLYFGDGDDDVIGMSTLAFNISSVPEPGILGLLGAGLFGLLVRRPVV